MWKLKTSSFSLTLNKYIERISVFAFDDYETAESVAKEMNQEDPETRTVVIPA